MNISGKTYNLIHKAFDIFLSGCNPPYCVECHNPVTWDFNYGQLINMDNLFERVKEDDLIEKVRIMGGEPLDQDFDELKKLIIGLKKTGKELWVFTKYLPFEIPSDILSFLYDNIDYIKHGRYLKNRESVTQYGIILASDNQFIQRIH